jgi:cold shock CspA family protein
MATQRESSNKKEVENRKKKKAKEKEQRKEERKAQSKDKKSLDDMIVYVDENGNFSSTPPDPAKKKVIREEDITIGVPRQEKGKQEDPIRKGTVTFFNSSKGYGFIKDADSQDSIFVHVNNVEEQIAEGNKVTFEVEMGHKGPNAIRVRVSR